MAEKSSCTVCGGTIDQEDMGVLVVDEFPAPFFKVCGACMKEAKIYDGKFGAGLITREDFARLILRRSADREKVRQEKRAPRTDGNFLYYTLTRPPVPGAIPKIGLLHAEAFDRRTFVSSIGRDAWGSALYDRELSDDELWEYEMQAPEYGLRLEFRRENE